MKQPDYPNKKLLGGVLLVAVLFLVVSKYVFPDSWQIWVFVGVYALFCVVQIYKMVYAWREGMKKYCLVNLAVMVFVGIIIYLLYRVL